LEFHALSKSHVITVKCYTSKTLKLAKM